MLCVVIIMDQHPMVHTRVCIVCTEDEFALDPFPDMIVYLSLGTDSPVGLTC
jgi:hypothetical protein